MSNEKEVLTQEQADEIEKAFMEDCEQITLRDGKQYFIPPLLLKDARKLIQSLQKIDTELILTNFVLNENEESAETNLFEVLLMAFKYNHPEITAEILENICDLKNTQEIIRIMIGLNGLKK